MSASYHYCRKAMNFNFSSASFETYPKNSSIVHYVRRQGCKDTALNNS